MLKWAVSFILFVFSFNHTVSPFTSHIFQRCQKGNEKIEKGNEKNRNFTRFQIWIQNTHFQRNKKKVLSTTSFIFQSNIAALYNNCIKIKYIIQYIKSIENVNNIAGIRRQKNKHTPNTYVLHLLQTKHKNFTKK